MISRDLNSTRDDNTPESSGTLFIVSTPIGNLADISYRAIETLKRVDLIAAEDTRVSKKLLTHYDISVPITSYHDYNKEKVVHTLVKRLLNGKSVALISDAGTPGISDPAFVLIREAIQNDINIEAVPGPTALIPALQLSGLPMDRFVFEGFLPPKKGRKKRLAMLTAEPRTLIFYESPYRLEKTLSDLYSFLGNRSIAIIRELTKMHQSIIRTTLENIQKNHDQISLKGEFVLVVEGFNRKHQKQKNHENKYKDNEQ